MIREIIDLPAGLEIECAKSNCQVSQIQVGPISGLRFRLRRGLFGIGRKSAEYSVQLTSPWEVVVEYEKIQPAGARIRYRIQE